MRIVSGFRGFQEVSEGMLHYEQQVYSLSFRRGMGRGFRLWGEAPPSSPPVFYAVFVGIDGLGYQFYQIEIIKVLWITTEKHNLYPVFLIWTHMSPIDNVPVL